MKTNKLVYVLLAIFLGFLGIHKFYTKRNIQGIIYLVFFWTGIPFIIGVVEAILAILRPADSNGNISVDGIAL